ncbi:DNA-binding protein HU [Emticicia aquatica]|uniref:DNA-binding protein HU n=1 Tax=Emticicia aquatica TaxID=1681835 RepID=A0ABN8EQX1_9BACT|nr:HU family DNA-binding protein [Emticicia aquatica]CAH0995296.1 DNA-binding protein HU [Emticicia aquatica]
MTKSELFNKISADTHLKIDEVSATIETLFELIKQEATAGNKVTFKGFGSFTVKKRSAKKTQLIHKKKTISIEEYYIPSFLPSAAFKELTKSL